MIELTRIGQRQPFLLNPDLIERIDCHVDSVIRLTNGVEYVVVETGDEIVGRIVEFRRRSVGATPIVTHPGDGDVDDPAASDREATVVELPSHRTPPTRSPESRGPR